MIRASILAACLAAPAAAQEMDRWRSGLSSVEMRETPVGAEILFSNSNGDPTADHEAELTAGGVTVRIVVQLGRGADPDTLTVETPEGWVAIPRTLTIPDAAQGRVQVIPLDMDMM